MEATLPKMLRRVASDYPGVAAQYFRNSADGFDPVSYKDMFRNILDFAGGLLSLGVRRGDHVGLIADNRKEWLQADMGIMAIGAIDVPRGCDATEKDLRFILSVTDCQTIIGENSAQLRKIIGLKADLPSFSRLICLEPLSDADKKLAAEASIELLSFDDVAAAGKAFRAAEPGAVEAELEAGQRDDLACIIFTSGTTGEPKGVMLTHGNFLTQLDELQERIYLYPGDKALCVLPVWHAFQRLCEYVILCQAAALCYSKPVGSILLADFQKLNPQLLPAVPRVFESVYEGVFRLMRKTGGAVYALFRFFTAAAILHSKIDRRLFRKTARFGNDFLIPSWIVLVLPWLLLYPIKLLGGVLVFKKIRAKLGNSFRGGVSGGGALPPQIDEFFWAIGVNIVEGYGLTETAPVVSVRPLRKPVFGTVGSAIRGVEVRIVDAQGNVLPAGKKGVVQVRGGTVMKGYYRRDDLTANVMRDGGWFDTGDIGMLTVDGEIVLRGRMKDTIVLRGGENVEPLPIEMRLNESRYIAQSVVIGQDQRYLGALIVPSQEDVTAFADENCIRYTDYQSLLKQDEIIKLFDSEIQGAINAKNGFKLFEKIGRFALLAKPFEPGVELSAKQEIMRYKLSELYEKEIKLLFK
ncbi:AMP-dependent synthetase/ligase [Treponema brennaborense]|uniref:Long-chain-fatty-acid--CoA ligase., o-succinylbenzoate--CoA ligase n=1 Tax=Treponema brennaborense (strain DSM 12168 / CIP 105900 / DD5/3) TaxID=906968 RepID=F4LM69_TREBD|nr:AMP-binding protein [Treponema brennaborense]AEE17735.1 Long-chain-fatty-acid--CoA ligase., o-succinylbenzoate--CoA ligase [Treponema brennaborense DSM 12168]